jgi:hypothetical protein
MTPAERQLVTDLFDRLATLEDAARDPEADRLIRDGLRQAPNATYALVQSTLLQDEALKRALARIRELEAELGIQPEPQRQRGFLDTMRESMSGRQNERRGSVPNVRPGDVPMGAPRGYQSGGSPWPQQQPPLQQQQPMPQQQPGFGGGSFLGTAAAAAVGAIGGSLLMNSMGGMFGQRGGGSAQAAMSDPAARESGSPWGNAGSGDLARQAGIDDIGRGSGGGQPDQDYGLFDTASNQSGEADFADDDIADADFDGGFDVGGDGGD